MPNHRFLTFLVLALSLSALQVHGQNLVATSTCAATQFSPKPATQYTFTIPILSPFEEDQIEYLKEINQLTLQILADKQNHIYDIQKTKRLKKLVEKLKNQAHKEVR